MPQDEAKQHDLMERAKSDIAIRTLALFDDFVRAHGPYMTQAEILDAMTTELDRIGEWWRERMRSGM